MPPEQAATPPEKAAAPPGIAYPHNHPADDTLSV